MESTAAIRFARRWQFVRELTLSLLEAFNDDDLSFTPGEGLGILGMQFRHLGRVECNYVLALRTGHIEFGDPHKRADDPDLAGLLAYLQLADDELWSALKALEWETVIDWFGEPVDVDEHLHRMTQHETLHHGQLVVYVQALGRKFPTPWAAYGL
ncbi:MAG: DinB family protein [Acidimicrobiales bacterium]